MSDRADPNAGLEPIEPLVDHFTRQMGQLAGRLMVALSLLTDLEDSYGWERQGAQARDTVHYSRLLVASVLRVVARDQADRGDEAGLAEAIEEALRRLRDGDVS